MSADSILPIHGGQYGHVAQVLVVYDRETGFVHEQSQKERIASMMK